MKKMFFLIAILVLSTSVVFAQSVRQSSTAGLFGSDSDDISAEGIYGLDKSFASLGYFGDYIGAVGIEISPTMYLGVIGGFDFNDTKNENFTPDTTVTTYASPFDVTLAFGLNQNMGFHYSISRNGGTDTITKVDSDSTNGVKKEKKALWMHEIAFGMKLANGAEFYIPLSIPINLQSITTKYSTISSGVTTSNVETMNGLVSDPVADDKSSVNLSLKPTFSVPMDLGAFNKLKFGAGIDFAVYTNLDKIDEKTTTISTDTTNTKTRDPNKEYVDTTWNIAATPTFEWDINSQLNFMIEPTIDFGMNIFSEGKLQTTTTTTGTATPDTPELTDAEKTVITTTTITPSISLPVGAVYSPVDWFEIRAGIDYTVKGSITNTKKDRSASEQDDVKESNYTMSSGLTGHAGLGFIISEDFFIDIAFTSANYGFNFNAVTLQLSYKF